jgi:hypothetical protein
VVERCHIVVLGAGSLGPSPLFDTVSYGMAYSYFGARHDAVGLGGATCAPADCNVQTALSSCFVNSYINVAGTAQPAGCYAGTSGPQPGTVLAAGDNITWAAAADNDHAYSTYYRPAVASNRASGHGG